VTAILPLTTVLSVEYFLHHYKHTDTSALYISIIANCVASCYSKNAKYLVSMKKLVNLILWCFDMHDTEFIYNGFDSSRCFKEKPPR